MKLKTLLFVHFEAAAYPYIDRTALQPVYYTQIKQSSYTTSYNTPPSYILVDLA